MERQDEAWVLSTCDLGETDRIVNLFTADEGLVRGVARSARKSRRRFGGALEPLTRVRARWQARGRDLERIDACEPLESFAECLGRPETQALGAVLIEILERTVHPGQPEPDLYRLVGAVLRAVADGLDPWLARRYFEYWTLRVLGSFDEEGRCGVCARTLPERARVEADGRLACDGCATDDATRWSPSAAALLYRFATSAPADLDPADAALARSLELDRRPGGAIRATLEGPLRSERHFRAATAAGGNRA